MLFGLDPLQRMQCLHWKIPNTCRRFWHSSEWRRTLSLSTSCWRRSASPNMFGDSSQSSANGLFLLHRAEKVL